MVKDAVCKLNSLRSIADILRWNPRPRQADSNVPQIDRVSVAKLRLAGLEKQERQKADNQTAVANGKMTFKDASAIFKGRLEGDTNLKPRSKDYRKERITALLKSWPGLDARDVRQINNVSAHGNGPASAHEKYPIGLKGGRFHCQGGERFRGGELEGEEDQQVSLRRGSFQSLAEGRRRRMEG